MSEPTTTDADDDTTTTVSEPTTTDADDSTSTTVSGPTTTTADPSDFPFTLSPTTLNFPDTHIGDSTALTVTITNISTVTQDFIAAGGGTSDPNFNDLTTWGSSTLAAGTSCTFDYTFEPTAEGPLTTNTSIQLQVGPSGPFQDYPITLNGTGLAP